MLGECEAEIKDYERSCARMELGNHATKRVRGGDDAPRPAEQLSEAASLLKDFE